MNLPEFQYDDLFVYAPSFLAYERALEWGSTLDEGKALGTAREVDLVLLDKDRTMDAFLRPEEYAKARKSGATVGKRALKKVQDRVKRELMAAVSAHDSGETWNTEFKKEATRVMKRAWKEVFEAGVRASGIAGRGRGKKGVELSAEDQKWLKSAMAHEMRFLNGFIEDVTEQRYKMPLPRRVSMYVDALESFYDSARVIGMPANSVMRWVGPMDKRKCESCEYLVKHSPYHKKQLPTTPRSGLTICLTNCRDRLLIRVVSAEEGFRVLEQGKTRDQHIRALRKIKRQAHKPRRRLSESLYYARCHADLCEHEEPHAPV